MQPTPRVIPTANALKFMHTLLSFLEGLGLTFEDAEATIRNAILAHDGGAGPDEITTHFCDAHRVPADEAQHVGDLAALLVYRGRVKRVAGGKYEWTGRKPRPHVYAVVRIPTEEWQAFRGYAHTGRAVWVVDE